MPVTFPPVVVTGSVISAAYTNAMRAAAMQAYSEIALWSQDHNANGQDLTGADAISAVTVTASGAIAGASMSLAGSAEIYGISSLANSVITAGGYQQFNRPDGANMFRIAFSANDLKLRYSFNAGPTILEIDNLGVITATAKGHKLGTAGGTIYSGALAVTDANLVLYSNSSTNWAGIGVDNSGNIWFRAGLSGTPDSRFTILTNGTIIIPGAITGGASLALAGALSAASGTFSGTLTATGNVGIGTTSPASLLHLRAVEPVIRISDLANEGYTVYRAAASGELNFYGGQTTFSAFRFITTISGSPTEVFRINNNGSVGVGGPSPGGRLGINTTNDTEDGIRINGASSSSFLVLSGIHGGGANGYGRIAFWTGSALGPIHIDGTVEVLGAIRPGRTQAADVGGDVYLGRGAGAWRIATNYVAGYDFAVIDPGSSVRFLIKVGGRLALPNQTTYASNADAVSGGLVAGDVYWTSGGEMRRVV